MYIITRFPSPFCSCTVNQYTNDQGVVSSPIRRATRTSTGSSAVLNINDLPLPINTKDTALLQSAVFILDGVKYRSIHHKIDPLSLKIYQVYYSRCDRLSTNVSLIANAYKLRFHFVSKVECTHLTPQTLAIFLSTPLQYSCSVYVLQFELITWQALFVQLFVVTSKVGSQYTQTSHSVEGCHAILRKNRLEFHSCDSVATMLRQRLRVL